jgi:phage gp46-like protein
MKRYVRCLAVTFLSSVVTIVCGCKSYWIDATVENHTGQAIHELEVDYPSASFGSNGLASEAVMHYRFQVRGDGPIRVEYIGEGDKTIHGQGLTLSDHQQGQIVIRLLPKGKVEFVASLKPAA